MEVCFNFDFSDQFDCALSKFIDQLGDKDKLLLQGRISFRKDKGLLQEVKQLFRPRMENSAYSRDLIQYVDELWYWRCLRKVLIYIHKCSSNIDKTVPSWGSLMTKFEDAFSEIQEDITRFCRYKKIAKVSSLTLHGEKKIRLLDLEVGFVLVQLSRSCCSGSLEWHFPVLAPSLPYELLTYISEILGIIWLQIVDDQIVDREQKTAILDFKGNYISLLQSSIQKAAATVGSGYSSEDIMLHNEINFFYAHIAYVSVRIASQSFYYWINKNKDPIVVRSKITGLLDLQNEIDPLSDQFLELALQYLRAINGISPGQTEHLASFFLNHATPPARYQYDDSEWKLKPLIIFAINERGKPLWRVYWQKLKQCL